MSKVETKTFTTHEIFLSVQNGGFMLPREQRKLAWSDNDRKSFVATLLKYGHSLSSIGVRADNSGGKETLVLFDGHNRVSTILRFLRQPLLYVHADLRPSVFQHAVDAHPFADAAKFDAIVNIASVNNFHESPTFEQLLDNVQKEHAECRATQKTVALLRDDLNKLSTRGSKRKTLDAWCKHVNDFLSFKSRMRHIFTQRTVLDAVIQLQVYNDIPEIEIPMLMGIVNKGGVQMNEVQLLATTLSNRVVVVQDKGLECVLRSHLFRYYDIKKSASDLEVLPSQCFGPETPINAFEFMIALSSECTRFAGWPAGARILDAAIENCARGSGGGGCGASLAGHKRPRSTDSGDEDDFPIDDDDEEKSTEAAEAAEDVEEEEEARSSGMGSAAGAASASLLRLQTERPKDKHFSHQQFIFTLWRDFHKISRDAESEEEFNKSFSTPACSKFYDKLIPACETVASAIKWLTDKQPRFVPSPRVYCSLLLASMRGTGREQLQQLHIAHVVGASKALSKGAESTPVPPSAEAIREFCVKQIKHPKSVERNGKRTPRRPLHAWEAGLLAAFCCDRLTQQDCAMWRERDHIFPISSDISGSVDLNHIGNIMMIDRTLNAEKGKRVLFDCGSFNKMLPFERERITSRQMHPTLQECQAVWHNERIIDNEAYVRIVESRALQMIDALMKIYTQSSKGVRSSLAS